MASRFSSEQLRTLRNDIRIITVIGNLLELEVEGVYRFLCPLCGEFETGVHPKENLGRCFRCKKNYNPIDLVMAVRGIDFVSAVKLLLAYHKVSQSKKDSQQAVAKNSLTRKTLEELGLSSFF